MINKKELLAKLSSFWFFYRWHPEVALRYLPIVSEIKKMGSRIKILEVGSSGLGIAPYLKKEVTGVDVSFKPPYHPLLKRVKASAVKLPFADSSFEVIVSVDTLEHLRKEEREKAVSEMIRVGRSKIFIGVPCGEKAYNQDIELNKYYKNKFGKGFNFLEEQIYYGLPKVNDIYDTIGKSAKKHKKEIFIKVYGNENLGLRYFMMKGWITKNIIVDIFYRKILLFALPLLRLLNDGPTYRQLFFVTIQK